MSKNVLKKKEKKEKKCNCKTNWKEKSKKIQKKNYSTEKSAKEYFWIFHLMFQASQEIWSSVMMFSCSVSYDFCWGLFYICSVVFCSFHRSPQKKFVFRIKRNLIVIRNKSFCEHLKVSQTWWITFLPIFFPLKLLRNFF